MIDDDRTMQFESGKTYYLRVSSEASDSDMDGLGDTIKTLDLGCVIIVGRGNFDIEEMVDSVWGTVLR